MELKEKKILRVVEGNPSGKKRLLKLRLISSLYLVVK